MFFGFVDPMRHLHELNKLVYSKKFDLNSEICLQENVDVSEPLKMNVISYHYKDYLARRTLLEATDENTKAVHFRFI